MLTDLSTIFALETDLSPLNLNTTEKQQWQE